MADAPHPAYVYDGTDWQPIIGPEGPVGPPVQIKGQVPDKYTLIGGGPLSLPGVSGQPGIAYTTKDDGHIWSWDGPGSRWVDGGKLQGDKGDAGETFKISGVIQDPDALPTPPMDNSVPPKPALLTVLMTQAPVGNLFIYDPTSKVASDGNMQIQWDDSSGVGDTFVPAGWVNLGAIAGPQGPIGVDGPPGPGTVPGGVIGQVLTKVGALDTDVDWEDPLKPGEDGQYLVTIGKGATAVYAWQDPSKIVFPDDFEGAQDNGPGLLSWDGNAIETVIPELESLKNVAKVDGNPSDVLTWDGTKWTPAEPEVTQTSLDAQLGVMALGLSHEESVLDMLTAPPAAPSEGDRYIVGGVGTGLWASQDNKIAVWGGGRWGFTSPKQTETHLVEVRQSMFSWNGTAWVKVAMTNPNQMQYAPVGTIIQSTLTEAQFKAAQGQDAANWVLCDGRSCAGSDYAALTGWNNVADMRGGFLRMAGHHAANGAEWDGGALASHRNSSTKVNGLAATFTADRVADHWHTEGATTVNVTPDFGSEDAGNFYHHAQEFVYNGPTRYYHTKPSGAHTPTGVVALTGDSVTAPPHMSVNFFIRINGRNPSNTLCVVELTKAEYSGLAVKDPGVLYVIRKVVTP